MVDGIIMLAGRMSAVAMVVFCLVGVTGCDGKYFESELKTHPPRFPGQPAEPAHWAQPDGR
jgi:hypothetical protein